MMRFSVFLLLLAALPAWALPTNYFVSPTGIDSNSGSIVAPFRTIQTAANVASAGDTIYIRSGTYREQVSVPASASGSTSGLTKFFAFPGESPLISGADVVTGWTQLSGSGNPIWQRTNWPANSQQVFVDGVPLKQIGYGNTPNFPRCVMGSSLADMTAGTFYLDTTNQKLFVWLSNGSNPSSHLVEAGARSYAFDSRYASFLHLKGLAFRYSSSQDGQGWNEVGVGPDSIVESCDIQWGDFGGIALASRSQVISSTISNNGDVGVSAVNSATGIRVANNTVANNNYRSFSASWHCGGMKLIPNIDGIVEGNEVVNNSGPGIWWDSNNNGNSIIVRNNYVHGNHGDGCMFDQTVGIFIEISSNALVYNNLIADHHGVGIYISGSNNSSVFHNTVLGTTGYAAMAIGGVPRFDCGWLPNGVCTLKNNRVYNNVFVSPTSIYGYHDLIWMVNDPSMPSSNNTIDYNLYYNLSGTLVLSLNGGSIQPHYSWSTLLDWQSNTGLDAHSISVDPMFSSDGHHLSSSSPLIDHGSSGLGITTDYDGKSRPQGNGFDIGAFEYTQPLTGVCAVCHNNTTLYVPCGSAEYIEHLRHGDLPDCFQ